MNPHRFLRIPFAAVFDGQGIGKRFMPPASAQTLDLPVALVFLPGVHGRA